MFIYFILCSWVFDLHIFLCNTCMPCPGRKEESIGSPRNWSYGWLWATMWAIAIKVWSFSRSNILGHWFITLISKFINLNNEYKQTLSTYLYVHFISDYVFFSFATIFQKHIEDRGKDGEKKPRRCVRHSVKVLM